MDMCIMGFTYMSLIYAVQVLKKNILITQKKMADVILNKRFNTVLQRTVTANTPKSPP